VGMAVRWAALFGAMALGAALSRAPAASTDGQAASAARSPGAVTDQPVEDFSLRDIMAIPKRGTAEDSTVRLSDFKGKKHTVLFFFSEKCGHSKRSAKRVLDFVKQNASGPEAEVAFLGIRSNADDTVESMRRFARSLKLEFPILDDPDGKTARYFRVRVAPTFVLIDREGVQRFFGSFDNDDGHGYGASAFFLADAVKAVRSGEPVLIKRALPFG
jgi:peroxiredoxin